MLFGSLIYGRFDKGSIKGSLKGRDLYKGSIEGFRVWGLGSGLGGPFRGFDKGSV